MDLQQPLPTVEEQGLCIGATFGIKAYNGRDGGRRINVLGFCRSVEMLHDHVAAALHIRGGEIVAHEYKSEGLHENLKLTVALPYLWGVPPELDSLNTAIEDGESTGRAAGSRPRERLTQAARATGVGHASTDQAGASWTRSPTSGGCEGGRGGGGPPRCTMRGVN